MLLQWLLFLLTQLLVHLTRLSELLEYITQLLKSLQHNLLLRDASLILCKYFQLNCRCRKTNKGICNLLRDIYINQNCFCLKFK